MIQTFVTTNVLKIHLALQVRAKVYFRLTSNNIHLLTITLLRYILDILYDSSEVDVQYWTREGSLTGYC